MILSPSMPWELRGQDVAVFRPEVADTALVRESTLLFEDSPDFGLYDPSSAAEISPGLIAIGDRGNNRLVLLQRGVGVVSTIGGEGDGPGEFRLLGGVHAWPPDTVVAFDRSHQRLTAFGPAGDILVERSYHPPDGRRLSDVYRLGTNEWMGRTDDALVPVGPGEMGRDTVVFRSLAVADRITPGPVAFTAPGSVTTSMVWQGRLGVRHAVFSPRVLTATLGRCVAALPTDESELAVRDPDGQVVARVMLPTERRAPDEAALETLTVLVEQVPAELRSVMKRVLVESPRLTYLPEFNQLFLALDGSIWLQRWSPPLGEAAELWLVHPSMDRITVVKLPHAVQAYAMTMEGDLVGGSRDELGVVTIRLYDLPQAPVSVDGPVARACRE